MFLYTSGCSFASLFAALLFKRLSTMVIPASFLRAFSTYSRPSFAAVATLRTYFKLLPAAAIAPKPMDAGNACHAPSIAPCAISTAE